MRVKTLLATLALLGMTVATLAEEPAYDGIDNHLSNLYRLSDSKTQLEVN